jgi:glycerol-3-phosphate acyltransferase PlsY
MIELLVKGLIGYLAGSVVGSLLLGPLKGVDIRRVGSGNAGGTNALRTQGAGFALGVVFIDVFKVVLPLVFLTGVRLPLVPVEPTMSRDLVGVAIAAGAVLGHVYPLWYGFRGGKGMATLLGAYAVLDPMTLILVVASWLLVVALSGYVGLGTMLAAATAPVWLGATLRTGEPLFVFSVLMAGFIIYTHRSNISRMRAGNENRLWRGLLGRKAR